MNYLNPAKPGSRQHDNLKQYRHKSGVYILVVGSKFYVGSTKDLQSRLRYWSCFFPGAGFKVKPCADYRTQERRVFEALKARQFMLASSHNLVRPIRELKRQVQKPKPLGPGRTPDRMITVNGTTRTLSDWCRRAGIEKSLFYARLRIGWTEQAAVQPKMIARPRRKGT